MKTTQITFYDISIKQIAGRIALYIFLLMSILAIFWASNRKNIDYNYLICFILGYTAIAAIGSSIIVYLFSIFVKQWTLVRHYMLTVITTLIIWVCDSIFYYFCLNIYNFSFFKTMQLHFLVVFLIGIAIGSWGYFWIKGKYMYSNLLENEEQNDRQISRFLKENPEQKMITLYGNSSKSFLALFPQELIYIESTGNYVQIYYEIDKKIFHKKLRSTLSKIEEVLKDYSFIVRCHRAFIVNFLHINKISSSKIWLNTMETEIPISKTYKASIQKQINSIDRLSQI